MIFGKSKRERELLEQIKLGYAVLNNPKVKFAWLPVQIKAIEKEHIVNGKWIWLEKYISYKDRFVIGYYYQGYDGYDGEIYAIRKITRRGFFDYQKTYVVKYDKDFENDKFTLLGFYKTKKLVEEYIRKLEREFVGGL